MRSSIKQLKGQQISRSSQKGLIEANLSHSTNILTPPRNNDIDGLSILRLIIYIARAIYVSFGQEIL